MALTDWVQNAAVIYFAWQQNRIFTRQNQIIANQSERTAMPVETSRFRFLLRYWPTMAMVILALLTVYDIYDRHHVKEWQPLNAAIQMEGKKYINEVVDLDGKSFSDCTFTNVTLMYHGKSGVRLIHSHFIGSIHIATDDRAATAYYGVALALGLAKGDTLFADPSHPQELPGLPSKP